ncbi:peptidyl-prolyl cis-trans isomerase D [Klebsiella aerogenes]|nr:peptidyl-prolyl cis-trans isomerase D [Klebsiella aerogenes]
MGMTTDQYAQALRNQLTTQQLINAIAGTDFMLPGESDQLAALVSQQRVVREATINVNALAAKQTASDEEINAFWRQNQARFMAPEQFRVSYIKMDAASMQESASDEEIQSWYDQHKDQFTQPQRNRYSVIQTKTEADAKAVLAELQKGADFATLAKRKIDRYYLCPQRRRYGVDGRGLYGARAERCRAERERPAVWRHQILGWLPGGPSGRRPAGAGEAAG